MAVHGDAQPEAFAIGDHTLGEEIFLIDALGGVKLFIFETHDGPKAAITIPVDTDGTSVASMCEIQNQQRCPELQCLRSRRTSPRLKAVAGY